MTRTRLTPWVVLACIGTLAACTSTEGGQQGNTELNILIPNQSPNSTTGQTPIECNSVEYTIVCNGDQQPAGGFLNPNDGFVDAVTLNGNLEVDNNATPPIAQGYMDIPPGNCLAQLRCRDGDGEVICTGDNVLASTAEQTVVAGETLPVNIVLDCNNISAQAPVGQLDVRGSFAFAIGNWCPDLFVLNCVDTDLFPVDADPGPEVEGQTTCEVRYRDNDGGCNEGCDPQFCQEDANGLLSCTPASPPEDQDGNSMAGVNVRTTVECGGAPMDCANNGIFGGSTSCTYDGDSIGSLPTNIASQTVPNPRDFGVNCEGSAPGSTITCTATTTDGDLRRHRRATPRLRRGRLQRQLRYRGVRLHTHYVRA
jgi:hypothetical protein